MFICESSFLKKTKTSELTSNLKSKIFGQDEAIDLLINYINIYLAGLNDKNKPIGSFLFTGPTGVGKTELAKQLASELNIHFHRFDMSEFGSEQSADNLTGGAAGLVGYEEGGLLTNAIMENPYSVLLFDEIEKAHKTVLNKFLQIMDYGKLTSSKGKKVCFNKTIIIFTSNLNAVKTTKRTTGFNSESYTEYENDMNEFLSPEFIARINQVIKFNPIDKNISKMIIKKYFNQISELLKDRYITVEANDLLIEKIIDLSDENLGSRNIENLINKNIKVILSQELILGNIQNFSTVEFTWDEKINSYKYTIKKTDLTNKVVNIFVNITQLEQRITFYSNTGKLKYSLITF